MDAAITMLWQGNLALRLLEVGRPWGAQDRRHPGEGMVEVFTIEAYENLLSRQVLGDFGGVRLERHVPQGGLPARA